MTIASLRREVKRLKSRVGKVKTHKDYAYDPVGYVHEVLGFPFLPDILKEILLSLHQPPYRTLVTAGHSWGKTFIAAAAINYWYDSFDPSVCISTAPDARSVRGVLWKEVRVQRLRARLGEMMPVAPEMRSSPDHYAIGFTANKGESFQGRHDLRMLFVFDECVGIDPVFWETGGTMFKPEHGHAWLAICNPTDTTSQAFAEDNSTMPDGSPKWTPFRLDCLQHPNILEETAIPPRPPKVPAAVTLSQVNAWVQDWCDRILPEEAKPTDLEWPPRSGVWYRQGPIFQARCRGMWPEGGTYAVWSDLLWKSVEQQSFGFPVDQLPELGCDVARYGDDYSTWHGRWGNSSFHHESVNGWDVPQVATKCMDLAEAFAAKATKARQRSSAAINAKEIPLKVDDDNMGGGVTDILQREGYFVIPVGAGTRSLTGRYPNKRSELWFQSADRARAGLLGLGLLPKEAKARLRQQLLAVEWEPNSIGMRVVESKETTKEKIGRSPDDADAFNLAYLQGFEYDTARPIETGETRQIWKPGQEQNRPRRKLFG